MAGRCLVLWPGNAPKTHVRFLINVPRGSHDGATGWNDGFPLPDDRPLAEQLRGVLNDEFSLPDLNLIFPEEEFLAQRTQFGPNWENPQALLRMALNTILDDYVEPRSVFNQVAEANPDKLNHTQFDNHQAYRAAVRAVVKNYLHNAIFEFLPIELPDNNPVDGEPIQENWLFFLLVPDLSALGFFVIIPRWPDDEGQAYVYGGNKI